MDIIIYKTCQTTDNRNNSTDKVYFKEEILMYADKRHRIERENRSKQNEKEWQLKKQENEEIKKQRYLNQHF